MCRRGKGFGQDSTPLEYQLERSHFRQVGLLEQVLQVSVGLRLIVQLHDTYDVSKGFRTYVLKSLAERLCDMITLVSNVVFRRLDLRLACLLGQRFERSGGKALRITHAELAHELGTRKNGDILVF